MLHITSLVASARVLWGASNWPWGSTMLLMACVSPLVPLSSLYSWPWCVCAWLSGAVGVGMLWGDVGQRKGLIVDSGDWLKLLGHLDVQVFGNKMVVCNSTALGIVSLVNAAVVGLVLIGA